MKSFGQWLNDQAVEAHSIPEDIDDTPITIACSVCGIEMDLASYGIDKWEDVSEDDEFYCGGSPRCCP